MVTLVAVSCSPERTNRLHILTGSREHTWLFPNTRNPALFTNWFEDAPSDYHEQLLSVLFPVVYAFIHRESYPLAVRYLTVITSKGDLPLYTSALTAIAPTMSDNVLSAISRMLVVPRTQESRGIITYSTIHGQRIFLEELLKSYDLRLGASENPGPNFLTIVFILSKTRTFKNNRGTKEREFRIEKSLVEAGCKSGCSTGHSRWIGSANGVVW